MHKLAAPFLALLLGTALWWPRSANAAEQLGITIAAVRTYTAASYFDIELSTPMSSTCGTIVRADGVAVARLLSMAMAALLAQKPVDMGVSDSLSEAGFCELQYLKVSEP